MIIYVPPAEKHCHNLSNDWQLLQIQMWYSVIGSKDLG